MLQLIEKAKEHRGLMEIAEDRSRHHLALDGEQ
jgi:hypothetical protein